MSLIFSVPLFCALAALFSLLLQQLGVVADARSALESARVSLNIIGDVSLSDRDKETAIQAAAGRLFGKFVLITAKSLLACAVPALVVLALVLSGLVDTAELSAAASNWLVLLVSCLAAIAMLMLRR